MFFSRLQILAGDAAVSGGVLPSTVSATEDADFQKRVQELRRVWGRRAVVRGNPKIEIMIRRVVRMIRMVSPSLPIRVWGDHFAFCDCRGFCRGFRWHFPDG